VFCFKLSNTKVAESAQRVKNDPLHFRLNWPNLRESESAHPGSGSEGVPAR
jgi:hypothetical protein